MLGQCLVVDDNQNENGDLSKKCRRICDVYSFSRTSFHLAIKGNNAWTYNAVHNAPGHDSRIVQYEEELQYTDGLLMENVSPIMVW